MHQKQKGIHLIRPQWDKEVKWDIEACSMAALVFRLGVDFVLPLSQEAEEEEQPPTKIYQKVEC